MNDTPAIFEANINGKELWVSGPSGSSHVSYMLFVIQITNIKTFKMTSSISLKILRDGQWLKGPDTPTTRTYGHCKVQINYTSILVSGGLLLGTPKVFLIEYIKAGENGR